MSSKGFFDTSPVAKKHIPLLPRCGQCGLYKHCQSPKMSYSGKGRRKILIIGEGPGRQEDQQGKPFVGASGQLLEETLRKFGIELRKDCWLTNAAICRPISKTGGNRTPTEAEIDHCRPNLVKTIKELEPEIIVPLGGSAVKSLLGWLWKEDVGMISRWDGHQIPNQRLNAWICPTWHPAYILRSDYGSQKENDVRRLFFEQHLESMSKLEGRPWKKVPDYKSRIDVILDTDKAAKEINRLLSSSATGPIAFDYESNMLKPDSKKAEIVSCALSDGKRSFAFPWQGKVIPAMREFLLSGIPKIAANQKFELRWSMKEFGHGVNNMVFDTMLAAHVLDNRPNTKSVKFYGFTLLGVDAWDMEITPFFKAKAANEVNKIREAPIEKLLFYNAMDSLIEWKVAMIQAEQLGIKL